MNDQEYQGRELVRFLNQKTAYFDTVREFADSLADADLREALQWIENGAYGAGACFALQKAVNSITPRTNGPARIGQVLLHALYGKPFAYWGKLPEKTQKRIQSAVEWWMKRKHEFAQDLII